MNLEFSDPVTDQHFSIMCIPRETERQKVLSTKVSVRYGCAAATVQSASGAQNVSNVLNTNVNAVSGEQVMNETGKINRTELAEHEIAARRGTDGLGNPYVYGLIREPHSSFCLVSEGTVETSGALHEEYEDPGSVELWRYRAASPHTVPGPALAELHLKWAADAPEDEYGTMLHFGNCVQEALSYVSGSTDVDTTAEQAVAAGQGVCQDYAHVMIALLRMSGIPARYVVGLIPGEGETHAWVEANCRGYWYGIDPTNNLLADENYIKFSHGRDYSDCMISRGIFTNPYAIQSTRAGVTVQQVPQQ